MHVNAAVRTLATDASATRGDSLTVTAVAPISKASSSTTEMVNVGISRSVAPTSSRSGAEPRAVS
jgi:hypothetical protein